MPIVTAPELAGLTPRVNRRMFQGVATWEPAVAA